MTPSLTSVLADLYNSEINVSISCFWDGGWDVKLGDEMNGFKAETTLDDIDAIAPWLIESAKRIWPESHFAKTH